LIAGLPGQTPGGWRESLDWIGRLEAPHVSVYMLEIDEDSRLGMEILQGGARYGAQDVPSEDTIVELYETAVEHWAGWDCGATRFRTSRTGLRIAPQLEVLAAGAIRGVRSGRALLGRRDPLPEPRIARRLCRLPGARRVALRGDPAGGCR
jgi:hypothetical protein